MTRDRAGKIQRSARSSEPTDPARSSRNETDPSPPPSLASEDVGSPLTTEVDMLKAEQLSPAFERPPRRPTPAYLERAQSEGGDAVAFITTARAVRAFRPFEEREKVLLRLSERGGAGGPLRIDVLTVPSAERRRGRRHRSIAMGALLMVSALALFVPAALRTRSPAQSVEGSASASVTAATRPEAASPRDQTTRGASAPRDVASAGDRAAISATVRPTASAATNTNPARARRANTRPEASTVPAVVPLKERFWE